jgi:23S rRNA pseudouridine2605 synthase
LSAVVDPRGRPTVVDCVPTTGRVFPVGRLDLNTTGVLLLTNDGELTARLLHPRYHIEKEYLVTVGGNVTAQALDELRGGVALEEGLTSPAQVRVIGDGTGTGKFGTRLLITMHEGRKRQVRRMLEVVGYRVLALHRTRFAGLSDAGLRPGQARPLTRAEVEGLSRLATGR